MTLPPGAGGLPTAIPPARPPDRPTYHLGRHSAAFSLGFRPADGAKRISETNGEKCGREFIRKNYLALVLLPADARPQARGFGRSRTE